MEDSQIIGLYFLRDQQALTETAVKYASYCHSIAYRILGNHPDSEEVVNDTYLGAWNSIPPNHPRSLSAYLGKISRRLALNRWRMANTEKRGGGEPALALEELEGCIPSGTDIEGLLQSRELGAGINRFVKNLPQTERRVFVLRYWYLWSIAEIAGKFGFSESKVKSMLSRTRQKLLAHLKKEGLL